MRLGRKKTRVIGLTGLPASGKSTVIAHLKSKGASVFSADECVHDVLRQQDVVDLIEKNFPGIVAGGVVDRKKLGAAVFDAAEELSMLEKIIHPRVRRIEESWIEEQKKNKQPLCILEIPLLYETGADALCDEVWLAVAKEQTIHERLAARGWDRLRIKTTLQRFGPTDEKRKRADAVISSEQTLEETLAVVDKLLQD